MGYDSHQSSRWDCKRISFPAPLTWTSLGLSLVLHGGSRSVFLRSVRVQPTNVALHQIVLTFTTVYSSHEEGLL